MWLQKIHRFDVGCCGDKCKHVNQKIDQFREDNMSIIEEVAQLREATLKQVREAQNTNSLEDVRVSVLGKAGTLTR